VSSTWNSKVVSNATVPAGRPMNSEDTACMVCSNSMRKLWSCNGHSYFGCPNCEFVRVVPVPRREVLKDYYSKEYAVDQEGYRRNVRRNGRGDFELLERIKSPGRMLEVGCSWGLFLQMARNRGWEVRGVELSDAAARWARDRLGLEVIGGTVEESPFPGQAQFDAVVAWHVIEHVQDPMNFLRVLRSCLRPGGLLVLRTPNIRSLPARVNGGAWQWVGAPAHLSLFSTHSLQLAVEQAGFAVRHATTRRGDAYNPLFEIVRGSALKTGLHQTIKRLLQLQATSPGHASAGSRRVRLIERMSSLFDVGFFPLYPFEKLLDSAGCGPELFLVAERTDGDSNGQ
jgi:2-polyprenyl-3-methyl-5-hydroxy-6-metoxy-1,4-benzoquinol methylase